MTTLAVVQARMGSTRLPGKVLMPMGDNNSMHDTTLSWVLDALADVIGIDVTVVATSTEAADDEIERWCLDFANVPCVRGSEQDVLSRFVLAADNHDANILLRITGDCPFIDANVIGEVIRLRQATKAAYASNIHPPTWPDGLDVECFTREALDAADKEATKPIDRECVTSWIVRQRSRFSVSNLICPIPNLEGERWVLDTKDDYEFCYALAQKLGFSSSYLEILQVLEQSPDLQQLKSRGQRNERYFQALTEEANL